MKEVSGGQDYTGSYEEPAMPPPSQDQYCKSKSMFWEQSTKPPCSPATQGSHLGDFFSGIQLLALSHPDIQRLLQL